MTVLTCTHCWFILRFEKSKFDWSGVGEKCTLVDAKVYELPLSELIELCIGPGRILKLPLIENLGIASLLILAVVFHYILLLATQKIMVVTVAFCICSFYSCRQYSGLKMIMDIRSDTYANTTKSAGMRIIVAEQNSTVLAENQGISTPPGYAYYFRFSIVMRIMIIIIICLQIQQNKNSMVQSNISGEV